MSKIAITPNASGTGTINIVAPNTNTDRTLTIPDVTGNVVTTGDTGTVTGTMIGSLPTGSVLQVQYAQYTGTFSQNLTANTDTILGSVVLTLDITPRSTSSIIKLDSHVFHEWSNQAYATEAVWFFYRDSTVLKAPVASNRGSGISMSRLTFATDDATSTPEMVYYTYFDTPSTTSQITYKVGVRVYATSTLYVNRTVNDTDNTQSERGISFISAMEIAG